MCVCVLSPVGQPAEECIESVIIGVVMLTVVSRLRTSVMCRLCRTTGASCRHHFRIMLDQVTREKTGFSQAVSFEDKLLLFTRHRMKAKYSIIQ